MNLPDYNFLSAPLWLITILHIVTFTLHLIAMNFLLGGIIVILFAKLQDKWNNEVVRRFIKLFPSAMAATVTLGVAPLLFIQLVFHKQVYSASIVSAWFWGMIIIAAIISYYFLYGAAFDKTQNIFKIASYLTVALIGLIYISFVYSSVFSMMEHPKLISRLYASNQSGFVFNTDYGSYLFRWLHMLLGALTVGSFFVGWLGKNDDSVYNIGKTFYLWTMVAAMIVGILYLVSFGDFLVPFMRTPGIWWLTLSLILSLGSLHFYSKRKFIPSALMLFVSVLGMVVTRHYVRLMHLKDAFEPAAIPVKPQWSVFILFLICLVIAIAVIWYMFKLFLKKK